MKKTKLEVNPNYKWISKNIYKVGKRYRVRIAGISVYCHSRADAFDCKKEILSYTS